MSDSRSGHVQHLFYELTDINRNCWYTLRSPRTATNVHPPSSVHWSSKTVRSNCLHPVQLPVPLLQHYNMRPEWSSWCMDWAEREVKSSRPGQLWAPPPLHLVGTSVLSWGVKKLWREPDLSSPSSAEVTNAWSQTSAPPGRCWTLLHGVGGHNCTIIAQSIYYTKRLLWYIQGPAEIPDDFAKHLWVEPLTWGISWALLQR
jgi:hypothetical protein